MAKPITEQQLQEIESCDEYSLRHYDTEVQTLADSYRHLVYLLDETGVLQLNDDWAKEIQEHAKGIEGARDE